MKDFKFTKIQIGLIVLALFSFYFWNQSLPPAYSGTNKKEMSVKRGDSFWEIAQNLKTAGIIKSRLVFSLVAVFSGSFNSLKAGQYEFEPGASVFGVIGKIEKGDVLFGSDEIIVTFPEGLNMSEIILKMKESGFKDADKIEKMKASAFVDKFPLLNLVSSRYNNLEGFLYPDTYRFSKDAPLTEVVERMLKQFETKTAELRKRDVLAGRNFYEILTIASILEKEVPPADMPIASGILWKRIKIDMLLQADATLVYDLGRPLKRADIDTLDSEFNTYKNKGLPPTPISNPGLAALMAATYPQDSDYLYYLSRSSDKTTIFSRTFEEHDLARSKYLR
mgnify:CR=1 FL=1